MGLLKLLGVLSPAHISFFTLFSKKTKVGEDPLGNTYYRAPARKGYARERRWVIYKDTPEASAVPPEWHGWLHYQTDEIPSGESFRRKWQKPHTPNRTGTTAAYRPPGHVLQGGQRQEATGDYEAWNPPQ